MDDVHTNYKTLKENALKSSSKYTKISPESVIMHTAPGEARPLKLRTVGKIGVGLGLAAAGFGAYRYNEARKESNKPLLKISEDHTVRNVAVGIGGTALGVGAAASTVFPKLRGGSGRIVGAFKATKKLFVDPLMGKSVMEAIGLPKAKKLGDETVDAIVRLTPTEIVSRSEQTLKSKGVNIEGLSHVDLREQSKQFDARSTINMLKLS